MYIPASLPGAIIRRHTGTPFMGYSGATYLVQEICNALFDALFNFLPKTSEMDASVEATPHRRKALNWDREAEQLLEEVVALQPVVAQISAAKRWRDQAEAAARASGAMKVTQAHVSSVCRLEAELA